HGIIPAIAPPTHADRSTVRGEQPLVDGSCVMRPAIGVVEHARWRCPPLQRAAQRWHGELLAWGRPRCPADHAARPEIEHRRELAMDPRATIPVPALGVYRPDRHPQPRVRLSPGTRRPPPPRVVTRARDRQHPAHERNRKRPFLPLDASVPHGDGFAKYAVA